MPRRPGPPPKRDAERRRRNRENTPTSRAVSDGVARGPELAGEHSDVAARWYEALRRSGQAQFYEASDWAAAELTALAIDTFAERRSAVMLQAIGSLMANLLVTEGDRRRVRLELDRDEADEPASVTALSDYRAALSG